MSNITPYTFISPTVASQAASFHKGAEVTQDTPAEKTAKNQRRVQKQIKDDADYKLTVTGSPENSFMA